MQLQHSCLYLNYLPPFTPLLTMFYLMSGVLVMKTIVVKWKVLFPPKYNYTKSIHSSMHLYIHVCIHFYLITI